MSTRGKEAPGQAVTEMKIPASVQAELDKLAASSTSRIGWQPTDQQRAIILRYYPLKNKEQLAEYLGISDKTLRKWYKALAKEGGAS